MRVQEIKSWDVAQLGTWTEPDHVTYYCFHAVAIALVSRVIACRACL